MVAQLCPLRIWRALPLTEDSPSRDEIPEFAHIFYIESCCPLYAGRGVFAARASAIKGPQLREKSRGPSGAVIQIGSTRSMKLHAVRAYFIRHHNLLHHSKDSLQAHFIPGFSTGHLNRIDRSRAVAISARMKPVVPDLATSDHLQPCRSERSPTGIKQSPAQSPDLFTRASFGSVAWPCKAPQEADQSHRPRKRVSNHGK
jgi:hypothetical protein